MFGLTVAASCLLAFVEEMVAVLSGANDVSGRTLELPRN